MPLIKRLRVIFIGSVVINSLLFSASLVADPYPPLWDAGGGGGTGPSVHFQPVAWPSEPADPSDCGEACGEWKPYTRFQNKMADPRTQDPSNGGTSPQSYVNVASSCVDKALPSIYYALKQGATPDDDVVMFRWRVESSAHNYATGKNSGNFSSGNPWASALWTVFFDLDGSGYRSLAAHLDGSIGSPAEQIDRLAGIWGNSSNHSLDYVNEANVHLLGHNPTAFIGDTNKVLNFNNSVTPTEDWPNGAAETNWDYGTTRAKLVSHNTCNEYFIDYQIPVAMLDASALGGPEITRDTPISMMFCTSNSLNNPLQKDCAVNKSWTADTGVAAPFGDYLSFNQEEPYSQPIISSVTATAPLSCPGSYEINAKVQDTLALQNGVVVPSVQAVEFYYWFDADGDGAATAADIGSEWVKIANSATLDSGTLNSWSASWDATLLSKGKFLIGAQALDDNTKLDDDMTPSGVDNRTFSYFFGDANNEIYIADSWIAGQQALFPSHSPTLTPGASENWYGNPTVTGLQVALLGTAINACGVAPTVSLTSDATNVDAGGTVNYTITVSNPASNTESITLSTISDVLPDGFTYQGSSTTGITSSEPSISSQTLTWTLTPVTILAGTSSSLSFAATATSVSGTYNNNASAITSFGTLDADPLAIAVDSVRLSLTNTPDSFSVAADDTDQITFTLDFANDSVVDVTAANLTTTLPAGVNFVGCSGATCGIVGNDISWTVGAIAGGGTGAVSFVVTVDNTWSSNSLTLSGTLTATAPDSSTVNKVSATTVAVTGIPVTGEAAMSLSKTADSVLVAPAGTIIYTLDYINDGTASASNVVITDTLAAGTTFTSCTGGCSETGGVVTWNIGTVAAAGSGSVTVTTGVANPFTASNPAINSATVDWTGGTQVAASVDVGVTGASCNDYYFSSSTGNVGFDGTQNLAVISPIPVAGDTGSSSRITAVNTGYLEALRFYQDPATGSDVPFSGTIDTSIFIDRQNGQGLNVRATVYDYNPTTGATTSLGQLITLFNGSTKGELAFSIATSGTLAKDHRLLWVFEAEAANGDVDVQFQYGGTVTNDVSASGSTVALSNSSFCTTPPANLTLSNAVDDASITAGSTPVLTYEMVFSNSGQVTANNVVLVGTLPTGFSNCEYSINDKVSWASCSASESHTFAGVTAVAGFTDIYHIRGQVPAGKVDGDTLTAVAQIQSDQTSSRSVNAVTDVTAVAPSAVAELATSLSANKTNIVPGDTVTYSLTVTNVGGASGSNVKVTNVLPAATYYTYGTCSNSCDDSTPGTIEWTVGALSTGSSQTFTYTMVAGTSGLAAGVTVIADDVTSTADAIADAVSNSVSISLSGNPQLSITYSASPDTGLLASDEIMYTAVITNAGSATASDVIVNAPMINNILFSGSITASVGTAVFDTVNNQVVYNAGDLASGATATMTYKANIVAKLPSGNSTLTNIATLSAANALQQSDSAPVSASAEAVLSLLHSQSGTSAFPAASLTADVVGGTTLFVNRTDQFSLGQLIKIGASTVTITSISNKSILVSSAITASSGAPILASITLSINYQNTGDADALNVDIDEVLPTELTYYSASPSADSEPVVGNSGTITWNIGTLLPNESGVLKVVVFPTGTTGAFVSTATSTSTNATTVNVPITTTIGGITVSKSTATSVVSLGSNATYSITLSNSLSAAVANVSVSDILSEGFSYVVNSATVGGVLTEPTFDGGDTNKTQPLWSGITIPANGAVVISFSALVFADAGSGVYQNNVDVEVPVGVGLTEFDALATTAEDIAVLGADTGVIKGYVFNRLGASGSTYVDGSDVPLNGVEVVIHQSGDGCPGILSATCFVTYTDSDGYFEQTSAVGTWIVDIQQGTGGLLNSWSQTVGDNSSEVIVPDQGEVVDHNGFALVTNTAPTATAQSVSTAEDTDKAIVLSGTDAEGTIVSYAFNNPSNGTLSGTAPNLTYSPNLNFNGSDSFTFTVTDNDGAVSSSATISITVTDVNDAPAATAQSLTTDEDVDKAIVLAGTDVDGTIASYSVANPSNGTLSGTAPNLTYSPNLNFNGSDSFTFTVTDNDGATSPSATVSITVNAANDAPTATAQSVNAVENVDKAITLAGTDLDGTIASYTVGTPSNGSLSGSAPNLTYSPATDFIGNDSFTFTVTDNGGATSSSATVSITILEDLDGDGDPDVTDPDDDGDGIPDTEEGSGDADGDGIPNDRDTDSDGDGIPDEDEENIDTDGDGIPNYLDRDSDGDGIPDVIDGVVDSDGDGAPDYLDIDSDNDGLTDTTESDASGNDSDGDGIDDGYDVDQTGGNDANNDGIDDEVIGMDSDGDSIADRHDLDSDDDGIPDVIEAFLRTQDTDGDGVDDVVDVDQTGGNDLDGDGIDDMFDVDYSGGIDADGDGIDDNLLPQSDRDSDGVPDYLDLDSDEDGISDTAESGLSGVDTDGDGIDDSYDVDVTFGNDINLDGIDDDVSVVDTDNDNVPDMHDLDSDNDSLFDTQEAGVTDADFNALTDDTSAPLVEDPIDSDGDGIADFRDIDSNNDGTDDIDTGIVPELDADDDGQIDLTIDFDGDGIDDSHDLLPLVHGTGTVDLDEDDDGIADITEGMDDFDGDSIADYLDRDSDNDGLSDAFETDRPTHLAVDSDNDGIDDSVDVNVTGGVDANNDGVDDQFIEVDTDNDGSPDYLDTDADNDTISDSEEQVLIGLTGVDSDNDGIDDAVDVDMTGGSDINNDGLDDVMLNLIDFDNDGLPNFRDLDSDGDGALDIDEGTEDLDGDGNPNYLDVDSDGDGVNDSDENGDFNNDGINDRLQTSSMVETGLRGAGSSNWLIALILISAVFIRRSKYIKVMLLALVSITSLSTQANDTCDVGEAFSKTECWYLGAGIGISRLRPDPNETSWRSTDDNDSTFKVFTGFPFTDHLFAELNYENLGSAKMRNLNPSITQELDIGYSALGANVGYFLKEQDAEWNVYAKAGLSFLNTDTGEFVEQDFSTQVTFGAGVQWRFEESWFARFDLTSYDKDARVVGITIAKYFGGTTNRKPVKKIAPIEPEVVPEPQPIKEVEKTNPDLDGDGVLNEQDNCPDTAANTDVNEKGCPLMETITLNIQFDTAKAVIKPEFMEEINRVADKIKQHGEVKVFVEGHTDWQGKQVDNQPLSEARANAVAEVLKKKTELAEKFFSVYGYGELKPIADNNTPEGRYKNRRVVVILSQK